MRARAMGIAIVLTGCSLLVNPRAENEYDLADGGAQAPDGGERDGGPERDGGLDAGHVIPAAPVLRFPWNGFMTGSAHTGALPAERNALRPRFVWEPSEGAERYELQLTAACEAQTREACTFDGAIEGISTESEWRPEEALPVSLTAPVGRRYVWRARACNVAGCSAWSPVRYLDVGRQPSDFNGDGYADVLVGAPIEGSGLGNGYLFQGALLAPPSRELNEFIGASVLPAAIGWMVAAVGDVDADGFPDAVVSALVEPSGGVGEAGRAYLLGGIDDSIGLDVARPVVLESAHPRDTGLFGFSIGGAGDLDGDGFADFVIGAPQEDVDAIRSGRAYLYRGGASLPALETHELFSPTPESAGLFGYSVSIAGDLHGDGLVDLVVGAAGESGAGTSGSGRAYLYAGAPDVALTEPMTILSRSASASGGFGAAVASGGDMDGDGRADLVIGAPAEGASGAVHVYAGSRTGAEYVTAYSSIEAAPGGAIGTRISTSGDLDGDGHRDLVIGAYKDAAGSTQSGAVYHVLGTSDLASATLTRLVSPAPEMNAWFGVSVGLATDIDGDGRAELLVGAMETVGGQARAGRVYRYGHDGTVGLVTPGLTAPSTSAEAMFGSAVADTTVTGSGYDPI